MQCQKGQDGRQQESPATTGEAHCMKQQLLLCEKGNETKEGTLLLVWYDIIAVRSSNKDDDEQQQTIATNDDSEEEQGSFRTVPYHTNHGEEESPILLVECGVREHKRVGFKKQKCARRAAPEG